MRNLRKIGVYKEMQNSKSSLHGAIIGLLLLVRFYLRTCKKLTEWTSGYGTPWKYKHKKKWLLDIILKSRDITLPTKVCLVKAMVFPVVMYGCESWTIKKAESWRIDAFELWCWRRLLRVFSPGLEGDPTSPS